MRQQAGKNLLVDAAGEKHLRRVAEQTGNEAAAFVFLAGIHQRQAERDGVGIVHVGLKLRVLRGGQFLVGVEHQNPVAGGVLQRGVAGGGKIIAPRERINFRAEFARDLHRAVGRAGVHHDDLRREAAHGFQALREELFLILDNQANGQA